MRIHKQVWECSVCKHISAKSFTRWTFWYISHAHCRLWNVAMYNVYSGGVVSNINRKQWQTFLPKTYYLNVCLNDFQVFSYFTHVLKYDQLKCVYFRMLLRLVLNMPSHWETTQASALLGSSFDTNCSPQHQQTTSCTIIHEL